jgi:hypothetical protein
MFRLLRRTAAIRMVNIRTLLRAANPVLSTASLGKRIIEARVFLPRLQLSRFAPDEHLTRKPQNDWSLMIFSQRSDVKKHLMRPLKKSHFLAPSEPQPTAEKTEKDSAADAVTSTPLRDEEEPIFVTKQ